MAGLRISDLTEITAADLASDDVFLVRDISAGASRKITRAELTLAAIPNGDKGDITTSAGGATWTIDNDVVTYAKMQNISAQYSLLGRSSSGAGDIQEVATSADTFTLLGSANFSAMRTALSLVPGTNVQAYSANLVAIAALAVTDGNIIVGDGVTWVAESGATARASLGLGTGDSPQFAAINIGAATDTTITRTGAGDIAVEGNAIYRAGGTDVPVVDGGTGASTAAGAATNLGLGTGDTVQHLALNIGHATDTTLSRASAGVLQIESDPIMTRGASETVSGAKTFTTAGVNAQGHRIGSASGSSTSPTNSNTNLLLFNNSSTSWAGFGVDTSGNLYYVSGTSSPSLRWSLAVNSGQMTMGSAAMSDLSAHSLISGKWDVLWHYGPSMNGANAFGVYNSSTTGVYLSSGSTSWSATSDERTKDIVGGLEGDSLALLRQLAPISYRLKADVFWAALSGAEAPIRTGFGAAATLAVLPEIVHVPPKYDPNETELDPHDPDYMIKTLGVRQADLIPRLVRGIQQMADMIDALTARVAELEAR